MIAPSSLPDLLNLSCNASTGSVVAEAMWCDHVGRMKHDLDRFVAAQDGVYPQALAELERGAKRSHWMWFIFPQIAGLGQSAMARTYAIAGADEARAYLAHPVLGPRLMAVTQAVLAASGSAEAILGGIDAVKLRSSMTLFAAVADDPTLFRAALDRFFGGEDDRATLDLLASTPR
jgi:uncharacterized protein (DUF1810 family)